jgi:hypothetical protein
MALSKLADRLAGLRVLAAPVLQSDRMDRIDSAHSLATANFPAFVSARAREASERSVSGIPWRIPFPQAPGSLR